MIKKLFFSLIILTIFNPLIPAYEKMKVIYLKDGSRYEIPYKDGKSNGRAFLYDQKGRVLEFATYKEGLLDGIRFNSNLGEHYFNMGVFWNGLAQSHIQNAQRIIEDLKLFGKKRGQSLVVYYEDGTVYSECQFDKGLPSGNCIIYYHGGKIMAVDSYVNGKLNWSSKMYYLSGSLLAEYKYKNGLPDGLSAVYAQNGEVKISSYYKNGLLDGAVRVFYKDGTPCLKAIFSNGKLIKKLKYYFPFSNKVGYLAEFSDGKLVKSSAFSYEGEEEFSALY